MKKITKTLSAVLMLLFLTSCSSSGGKGAETIDYRELFPELYESEATSDNENNQETTARWSEIQGASPKDIFDAVDGATSTAEKTTKITTTTETAAETTSVATEPPIKIDHSQITKEVAKFVDGFTIIEIDGDDDGENEYYSYNYYTRKVSPLNISDMPEDRAGSVAIDVKEKTVVDLTTGEVVIKLENNENFVKLNHKYFYEGKVFVMSKEEAFDGDVYKLGIIGSDGKWLKPMSAELELCDYMNLKYFSSESRYFANGIMLITGRIGEYAHYLYSCVDDKILINTDEVYSFFNFATFLFATKDQLFFREEGRLYIYDVKTNELKRDERYRVHVHELKGEYLLASTLETSQFMIKDCNDLFVLDSNLNKVIDLSEYREQWREIFGVNSERVLFKAEGKSGDYYLCMVNSDGTREFEPIKMNTTYGADDFVFLDDKFISLKDNKIYYYDTKEWITFYNKEEAIVSLNGYDEETDTFLCPKERRLFINSDGNAVVGFS